MTELMPPKPRRDPLESPVELAGAALIGGRPLLWTSIVIATATVFLGLTNAVTIDGWAAELAPSEAVARLNAATARWTVTTDAEALGTPRARLHKAWVKAEAARF